MTYFEHFAFSGGQAAIGATQDEAKCGAGDPVTVADLPAGDG
jgi:hypothetical protein